MIPVADEYRTPADASRSGPPAPRSSRRPFHFTVSFEFDSQPPLTHRGQVLAAIPASGTRMAVKAATKALHPARWRSVVCVLDRGAH